MLYRQAERSPTDFKGIEQIILNDPVEVALPRGDQLVWCPGIVVGRTLAASPRYDIRLRDGRIRANVPRNQLRRSRGHEIVTVPV